MTVLSRPRHPIVANALQMAREWCAGHIIDGAPSLGHAVKVALTLGTHRDETLVRPRLLAGTGIVCASP